MLKFRISQPIIIQPPQPHPEQQQEEEGGNADDNGSDPYYASHRTSDYDPYYGDHTITIVGDEESQHEKAFNEKDDLPPSLPEPSFMTQAAEAPTITVTFPERRSSSPSGRKKGAHLPEIQVPFRDSITGASNMHKRHEEEYKEVNLS